MMKNKALTSQFLVEIKHKGQIINNSFTMLLIDDIPSNIHSLKMIIEENFEKVNIITALSAQEAIKKIMQYDVDLILSDVQMPDISGLELSAYLHAIEQTKDIPIILITGIHNTLENIKKGFETGAIEYISKPIDDELLCSKLQVFIRIYEARKQDKEIIVNKDKLLEDQLKVITMINNLEYLPESSNSLKKLEEYHTLVNTDDSLVDLSNLDNFKKEV